MQTLIDQFHLFAATKLGQAVLSFLRVAVAAMLGAWVQDGVPLSLDGFDAYLQLGVAAGAALVLANYFGPWEKRYGRNKRA